MTTENHKMTDDLAELNGEPGDLVTEIRGMREDLRIGLNRLDHERVGRQSTRRLAIAIGSLVTVSLLVGGIFFVNYIKAGQLSCSTRIASREDIRAGIAAATDEVAIYAEVPDSERPELRLKVEARVRQELPDPC